VDARLHPLRLRSSHRVSHFTSCDARSQSYDFEIYNYNSSVTVG
jgi:hypothetical protein